MLCVDLLDDNQRNNVDVMSIWNLGDFDLRIVAPNNKISTKGDDADRTLFLNLVWVGILAGL